MVLRSGVPLAVGKFSRYLPHHLDALDEARLLGLLCARSLPEQWDQLLGMGVWFGELAAEVAGILGLPHDPHQARSLIRELERLRTQPVPFRPSL